MGSSSYDARLAQPVNLIIRSAQTLRTFTALPLRLLEHEKRRVTTFDVNWATGAVCEMFRPYLEDARINLHVQLADGSLSIRGSVASWEAILSNLLINSINALGRGQGRNREIRIQTERGELHAILRVLDSGPGIREISLEDIW